MTKQLAELTHDIFGDVFPGDVVLFRVDAGKIPGLSFGHVVRCALLGAELKKKGAAVSFIMQPNSEGNAFVAQYGFPVLHTRQRSALSETAAMVRTLCPTWLVIDLPYTDLEYGMLTEIRPFGTHILFIDDTRYVSPDVDIVLNSSIFAESNTAAARHINSRHFLGPRYFITDMSPETPTHGPSHQPVRVLASFGGSDPSGLSAKIIDFFSGSVFDAITVTLILGPGFGASADVVQAAARCATPLTVVRAPHDMYAYFEWCDIALCAGGRTLYELSRMNKPVIAIASIEHEIPVVREFARHYAEIDGLESWDGDTFNQVFSTALHALAH